MRGDSYDVDGTKQGNMIRNNPFISHTEWVNLETAFTMSFKAVLPQMPRTGTTYILQRHI